MAWTGISYIVMAITLPMLVTCGCFEDAVQSHQIKHLRWKERLSAGMVWNISHNVELISNPQDMFIANDSLYLIQDFNLDGGTNKNRCDLVNNGLSLQIQCQEDKLTITVGIDVTYTDDFPPIFNNQSYVAHILEGNEKGAVVKKFTNGDVYDKDCGTNTFVYNLENSEGVDPGMFGINPSTNEVFVNSTLEYKRNHEYHLNVSVTSTIGAEPKGKQAFVTLTVYVDDVDDRDPMFVVPIFELDVQEKTDLSGQWLQSNPAIYAYDRDTGINETVLYSISNTNPDLDIEIDQNNGSIKINTVLDIEKKSTFHVLLKAEQSDKSFKSAEAELILNVQDVNDHLPVFQDHDRVISLHEDAPEGTWVMALHVTDNDTGDNAQNNLTIASDDSSAFDLRQAYTDGLTWLVVKDAHALRGKEAAHITIHATPVTPFFQNLTCNYTISCATTITVNLTGINGTHDVTPMFGQDSYVFSVYQSDIGLSVGNISVINPRTGDGHRVSYSISSLPGSDSGCDDIFEINDHSGEITIAQNLQETKLCLFQAKACANIGRAICSDVQVTIEVQAMAPSYDVSLFEDVPVGTFVLMLPGRSLKIDSVDVFEIKSNQLVTKILLDRETKSYYNVSITEGNGNRVVSTVHVRVQDVNDNTPIPGKSDYSVALTGLEASGQKIALIKATDEDEGPNGDVSYSLINGGEWFTIGHDTGVVALKKMPPSDDKGRLIEVFAIIQDNGSPPLKTFVKLQMSIPSTNATTPLIIAITRDKVIKDLVNIESTLSAVLGHPTTIVKVDPLADVNEIGSTVFIKAHYKNGTEIPPSQLKRMLSLHAQDIYDKLHHKESTDDDGHVYKTLFIVATCLMAFFLVVVVVTCRYYRTRNKQHRQKLSIMKTLTKDTMIYDNTGKDDDLFVMKNGGSSVGRSNGGHSTNGPTTSVSNYDNPAFVHDDYENVDDPSTIYAKVNKNERITNIDHNEETPDSNENNNNTLVYDSGISDNFCLRPSTSAGQLEEPIEREDNDIDNDKQNDNSTHTKPFISTITIERPQDRSSNAANTNNDVSAPNTSHAICESNSIPMANETKDETLDSDNGFPYEKEGRDNADRSSPKKYTHEEEGEVSSLNSSSTATGGIPVEPKPDYNKLVMFEKSPDKAIEIVIEKDTGVDGYDPSAFYFLDSQEATSL